MNVPTASAKNMDFVLAPSRQRARRMRLARYRAEEATMGKAVPFQTAWRGFAARRALRMKQEEKDKEWHAAVLLQRAWYR